MCLLIHMLSWLPVCCRTCCHGSVFVSLATCILTHCFPSNVFIDTFVSVATYYCIKCIIAALIISSFGQTHNDTDRCHKYDHIYYYIILYNTDHKQYRSVGLFRTVDPIGDVFHVTEVHQIFVHLLYA